MQPIFALISGKAYAGKDTLADGLRDLLRDLEQATSPARPRKVSRLTFSDLICEEADLGIDAVRSGISSGRRSDEVVADVAAAVHLDDEAARFFYDTILDDLWSDRHLRARTRTPAVRTLLVKLGKDWRPDGYFAERTVKKCLRLRADGRDVLAAGFRYPAEFQLAVDAGALALRLDISPETQDARALARDGHVLSDEARNHPSETALDHVTTWDVRLRTDALDPATVLAGVAPVVLSRAGYDTTFRAVRRP